MAEYNKDMFEERRKLKGLTGANRHKKYMIKDDIVAELDKIETAYDKDIVKGRKALAKLRRMFMTNKSDKIELIDKDDKIQD